MSDAMPDTIIVGGGLCGLALAHQLHAQGCTFALYESRERLGGRILSVPCATAGMLLDLGPTWFWPNTQPRITQLVDDLGLVSFLQHDDGKVLRLTDHDKKPDTVQIDNLHGGARRLAGGMVALVDSLASTLPPAAIHLAHELISVHDQGDYVELLFRVGEATQRVRARRVVLAIPPRLLDERVDFEPALDTGTREAMRATHTWMADRAKVVVGYVSPFWRAAGTSGNAFVEHEQVVLGELFDACDGGAAHAALGGFFALSPQYRASVHPDIMPMLISSQLVQVFGQHAEQGEQHMQDWATDPFTCSALDLTPPEGHPEYGNPALRRALWDGKLFLGGSETAGYGGGYMEGALEAAARIQRALADRPAQASGDHAASLIHFSTAVQHLRSGALERYRQHLHRLLAAQLKAQLSQRAVLDTVAQIYSAALDELAMLPFDMTSIPVQRGRSDLTPPLLSGFEGFNAALLEEVVEFNRTSCALSNFPAEHQPAQDYLDVITHDLAAAWREFALNLNGMLLAKAGNDEQRARIG